MGKALERKIAEAGVPEARRHLFFCIGPDCCSKREGQVLWEHAKSRIKGLGIPVMRTKAGCFRICKGGPWVVVYPEGVWYGEVTPEKLDRVLREHVIRGEPVREWQAVENPLCGCGEKLPGVGLTTKD